MTPEQINIAIAEACGWEPDRHFNDPIHWHKGTMLARSADELPNYCNDLNAIHEAEKTLALNSSGAYSLYLSFLALKTITSVCADASQRAEALLRTIGKWKEQPSAPNL